MIKLETHAHSFGGSYCATSPNEVLVDAYVKAGYGGIVITNHFSQSSYGLLKGETHAEKVRSYFALIENMREMFKPFNIKVFYGTEVCAVSLKADGYEEYMIYGISEKDMADSKPLFTFTQEGLFRFAEKRGLFMYQTHPFRDRVIAGDPRFMHGAESFNGHFHHYNHNDIAKEFCAKYSLIGMSGTDYHHEGQPITAGIYIPENICTNEQLTEFLLQNKFKTIEDADTYESALKRYKENV